MSAIYDNVRHTLGLYIERCGWGVARAWLVFVNWSSDGTGVEDAVEAVMAWGGPQRRRHRKRSMKW